MSNPGELPQASARLHGMDALRSLLMLLGVVIHAADPYAVGSRWLVRDPNGSVFFDRLVDAIHTFRMPAFFLISGFFSMLLLRRWSTSQFLRDRARRIGLPLLATLLTFNLLQVGWLAAQAAPGSQWQWATWLDAWRSGHWLGHLWFLVYLLGYCLGAALLAPGLRRLPCAGYWQPRWRAWMLMLIGSCALLLPRAVAFVRPEWGQLTLAGLVDPLEWLYYLPFFAGGVLLQSNAILLDEFSAFTGVDVIVALCTGAAVQWIGEDPQTLGMKILLALASALWVWWLVRAVLTIGLRLLARPWHGWRKLADASYSVYLFHHVIVVMVATWLATWQVPLALKFTTVLAVALLLPLLLHYRLVLRQPNLRLWFNGYRRRAEPATGVGYKGATGDGALN